MSPDSGSGADERRTPAGYSSVDIARYENEIEAARSGRRVCISRKAAAWYLGIHPVTLSKLTVEGVGPLYITKGPHDTPRSRKFFSLEDLDEWMECHRAQSYGERRRQIELERLKREERMLATDSQIREVRTATTKLKQKSRW